VLRDGLVEQLPRVELLVRRQVGKEQVVRATRFVAEVFRQSVQPRAWSKRRRERVKECLLLQLSDFSSPEPLTLDVASLAGVPASVRSGVVLRKVSQVLPLFASAAKLHRHAFSSFHFV
jgi:hypothetical protein